MSIGDLVKLKGFELTDPNDIPHGIIAANFGLGKFKVRWLNDDIAGRWALTPIVSADKLELINSVKVSDS